jgi:CubicO group peptidase (beta-lactamase class C family)
MKRAGAAVVGVSLLALVAAVGQPREAHAAEPASATAALPADAEILGLLRARIDDQRMGLGMVVGVIDASGPRIVSYGVRAQDDPRPVDGETVFEVQSITKTFTALLLADMVQRGEVSLDDPVACYLPPGVKVPERNGRQITLVDLATHTSGLPDGFSNLRFRTDGQPGYEDYTSDDLYAFLSSYTLAREPGSAWEYSSAGMAILGHALARRAGMDFAELMRTRILVPLGMTSSAIIPTEAMKARLASGHDYYLKRVNPEYRPRMLEPAWALRSTARDLLSYLAAELGYRDTPLRAAMAMQRAVRRPGQTGNGRQGLGWGVREIPGGEFAAHNGGGRGFGAYAGFNTATRAGVIVLTNRDRMTGDDIARHLIFGTPVVAFPPPRPPTPHTEIAVDPAQMEKYAGSYLIADRGQRVTIAVRGGRLFGQTAGSIEIPLYPESPTEFFAKGPDLLVSFQALGDRVPGLWLQLNGEVLNAARTEPLAQPSAPERPAR